RRSFAPSPATQRPLPPPPLPPPHPPSRYTLSLHDALPISYLQDSYPTTHPIVADIVDLEAARQNFDGITYAKGAAVIKQLFHYVGDTAFLDACRIYFQRYSFGSAQLADFLKILEEAS